MRIVFAGTPDVAVETLDALVESGHEIVAVLTRAPAPRGRHRTPVPSPVHNRAEQLGLRVLTPKTLKGYRESLTQLNADVAFVVAYGMLIPADALDVFPLGWFNVHFSLLPRWRGAAPVQYAIRAGDDISGISIFRIDSGLDTGPLIAVDPYRLGPAATTGHALKMLAHRGARLATMVADALSSDTPPKLHPQPEEGITLAPRLTTEFAHIDWQLSATEIDRLIRSCTPEPGAWTQLPDGTRIKLLPPLVTDNHDLKPGELQISKHEVRVGTGDGDLVLSSVQKQGKGEMPASDWARGAHLGEDSSFV
ncbi:MAG: methionyl-tRNA formyltransferase [Varibaculum sp.]|nr:methionyl-tRNA formyltransferase [Varibaculum sp.]